MKILLAGKDTSALSGREQHAQSRCSVEAISNNVDKGCSFIDTHCWNAERGVLEEFGLGDRVARLCSDRTCS